MGTLLRGVLIGRGGTLVKGVSTGSIEGPWSIFVFD